MFQITIFCEDNKLHKVMWALDGLVVGMPQTIPVRGATAVKEKGKTKVKATTSSEAGLPRLRERLSVMASGTVLPIQDLVKMAIDCGIRKQQAYNYLFVLSKREKLLTKKEKGVYVVN